MDLSKEKGRRRRKLKLWEDSKGKGRELTPEQNTTLPIGTFIFKQHPPYKQGKKEAM